MVKVNIDGLWYLINRTERTAKVTFSSDKQEKYEGHIIIPEIVQFEDVEYNVTSIGEYAFQDCLNLLTVIVSNNVTKIEWHAFEECQNLSSIHLSNKITSIDCRAFEGCVSLLEILIPSSVTFLGDYILKDCASLQRIIVEEGNTKFDSRKDCNAIIETETNTLIVGCKSSKIAEDIEVVGHCAFCGCIGLTSIFIPKSVVKIQTDVFIGCSHVESIVVEQGNSSYDSRGDSNAIIDTCSASLIVGCKNTIIPKGISSIGNAAFLNCSYLTNMIIPKGVTTIGRYAFHGCDRLDSIIIPEGLEYIGTGAFRDCKSLSSIDIPHSVYHIGEYAFEGCSELNSVNISENLTTINGGLFKGCKSLTTFFLPDNIQQINFSAFENCINLTHVRMSNQIEWIGYYAFKNCSQLTSINLSENIENIGGAVFEGCTKLVDIYSYTVHPPKESIYFKDGDIIGVIFAEEQLETIRLHVPINLVECYEKAYPWNCFKHIVPFAAKVEKITLNVAKVLLIKENVLSLFPTVYPNYATNKNLMWSSSNEEVAVVNSKGRVVALSRGSAIITATANDGSGVCASCEVMVKKPIKEIQLNQTSVNLVKGKTFMLDVTVIPSDADETSFAWSTDDDDVAMLVGDGRIVAVSSGTTKITVTANDGSGASAVCNVIVTEV